MKKIVLAEKPSVGRDLARVLNCNKKANGYLEGDKYIVTWALGHLVTLADPEIYNKKYKTWKMEDLPILPKDMELVVIRNTNKQFNIVRQQILRKDVDQIIIATDAGREGELVARWIIEKINVKKPIQRLWISSVTDKAIKDGFKNLKDGKNYEKLYLSALARAEVDWIVGINATRALTCKFNAQLSCGRVQTPTLAMIGKREEEIQNFKPKTFYGLEAISNNLKLTWQNSNTKDIRIFNKKEADRIVNSIKNKEAKVINVDKKYKKSFSPRLYDLTELQRDANKIFSYSAKETLSIMQKLYERHKILTYPRTDSRYITADIVETLKDRLKACGVGPYKKFAYKVLQKPIKASKSFVDDKQVSDHHAIIPTEEYVELSSLSRQERNIYDLVVKRFISVLYPPFEYEETSIRSKIGEEIFIAKGKRVISQGWKEIYQNNYEDEDSKEDILEQRLPHINKGDSLKISSINQRVGKTKPPAAFNEGTLLTAMENPVKYMADANKDLIKTIGKAGGIGTVATRADIIEKLLSSFLIEKKGKDLFITSKGKQLLELVTEDLKSPALTAEWEEKLGAISKGSLNKDSFVKEMKDYTKVIVKDIKNSDKIFKHDNITRNKCPDCGKYMLEVKGKRGKMLVCQSRECGHRRNLTKNTNARCPNCRKKLELRGQGEGQIFACSCGYRERLSAFQERRKKQGGKVSKREVAKYMRQQEKEDDKFKNTALADALAKLKL